MKNILYLTDFSKASNAALPFATGLARAHDTKIYALHILLPDLFVYMTPESPVVAADFQEKAAIEEMQRVEAELKGLPREAILERADNLWAALEPKLRQCEIDLIVVGTQGRNGLQKLILGSSAERILRRSGVPVMVVGPGVTNDTRSVGRFQRVMLATDFRPESVAAAPYAISLVRENHAELILLHVIEKRPGVMTVAEALHQLYETLPAEPEFRMRSDTVVEHGEPAARILATAKQKQIDLIVLGVRNPGDVFTATHLNSTAHRVIAQAECPVLTVCINPA